MHYAEHINCGRSHSGCMCRLRLMSSIGKRGASPNGVCEWQERERGPEETPDVDFAGQERDGSRGGSDNGEFSNAKPNARWTGILQFFDAGSTETVSVAYAERWRRGQSPFVTLTKLPWHRHAFPSIHRHETHAYTQTSCVQRRQVSCSSTDSTDLEARRVVAGTPRSSRLDGPMRIPPPSLIRSWWGTFVLRVQVCYNLG